MKTVFTARELMEVALEEIMCLTNTNEDEMKTYYCHTEGRIVPKTQVIEVCDPLGHQVEFSKDDGEAA